jgi:hypothetical protein
MRSEGSCAEVLAVRYDDELGGLKPDEKKRADWQRKDQSGYRNWLARVMERRGTWPVPPIIMDNRRPLPELQFAELPMHFVLIEGHRRLGFARSLAADGLLGPEHTVWRLRFEAEAGNTG